MKRSLQGQCTGAHAIVLRKINRTLFLLLFALLLLPCGNAFAADASQDILDTKQFQHVWKKLSDICNDAKDVLVKGDRTSKTTLEVITFRDSKYSRLLKKARNILVESEENPQFAAIEKLQAKNSTLKKEITTLKNERISVPAESKNPLVKTRKKIDNRLAEIPIEIEENNQKIDELEDEILDSLHRTGVEIDKTQLNYFLIAAEGDVLKDLMNIANNMKKMQLVIEKQLKEEHNNIDLAKVYTGMHLISLEAYIAAHEEGIKKISGYRARLTPIIDEALLNLKESERLMRTASQAESENLTTNIRMSTKTIEVAQMYSSLLERRVANLKHSMQSLTRKAEHARNTYKTITNGSSLISLVNASSNDYGLLMDFEMPELKTIYDAGILNAFMDISEKIKLEK